MFSINHTVCTESSGTVNHAYHWGEILYRCREGYLPHVVVRVALAYRLAQFITPSSFSAVMLTPCTPLSTPARVPRGHYRTSQNQKGPERKCGSFPSGCRWGKRPTGKWLAQSKSEFESLFSSTRLLWPLTLTRPSAITHRPERRGTDQQHGGLMQGSSLAVWPLSHDGQEVVEHAGSSPVGLGKHRVTLQASWGFTSKALYEVVKQG